MIAKPIPARSAAEGKMAGSALGAVRRIAAWAHAYPRTNRVTYAGRFEGALLFLPSPTRTTAKMARAIARIVRASDAPAFARARALDSATPLMGPPSLDAVPAQPHARSEPSRG